MLLLIDLDNKREDLLTFDVGDILVFDSDRPYYLVIYDIPHKSYRLLSLDTYMAYKEYKWLSNLVEDANDIDMCDGSELVEVLKLEEVVLRRVADE